MKKVIGSLLVISGFIACQPKTEKSVNSAPSNAFGYVIDSSENINTVVKAINAGANFDTSIFKSIYSDTAVIYDNMKKQLTEYTEDLKQCKINDKQIKVLNRVNWAFLLRLILLTPFAMLGVITHIVPYKLVHVIAENFSENNSFRGALKVSLGMLMFAITNLIWVSLFYAQFHSIPLSILMFFILPIVGIITFYWSRNLGLLMKWISIKYFKKEDYIRLQRRRVQLIYSIENYFES